MNLYVGIDLGTSGCRAIAIDDQGDISASCSVALPAPNRNGADVEQDPEIWWRATRAALGALVAELPPTTRVAALAVDGTSGTVLLTDKDGDPLGPALMYHDSRSRSQALRIATYAPAASGAHGATSSLAKVLWLLEHTDVQKACYALHQADWISGRLGGSFGYTDYNNALKLGYDVERCAWPDWMKKLPLRSDLLPVVLVPGDRIGSVAADVATELGLPTDAWIIAGTTDSVAAFRATGANRTGDAVTSLGSTLVLKVLSDQPIFAPEFGVYSHRFDNRWLAGGASNTGGAILKTYFTEEQMAALSERLRLTEPTNLDYYPLPATGERFPVADPDLAPRVTPRPTNDVVFFQGLLEGIAAIEKEGYQLLSRLGAPYPATLRSVGGGAKNRQWTEIRRRLLDVPFVAALHQEAAYGTALLARDGYRSRRRQPMTN